MRFHWSRLLTNPKTRVLSQDAECTTLHVDGLVCSDVCAVRTKQALQAMPGVTRVKVDFDTGIAKVEGAPQDADAYDRAVKGAVAGKPLRAAIERVARVFGHRTAAERDQASGPLDSATR